MGSANEEQEHNFKDWDWFLQVQKASLIFLQRADLLVISTLVTSGHGMYYLDEMFERKKYCSIL